MATARDRCAFFGSRFLAWGFLAIAAPLLAGCNLFEGGSSSSGGGAAPGALKSPSSGTMGNYGGSCTTGSAGSASTFGSNPLFKYQWYLQNLQQTAFADCIGATSADINYGTPTVTGAGIIIAVLDTGLEIAHEDLSGNVIAGKSYNYVNGTTDPTNSLTTGDHGTSVGGIAAAANNTVGLVGVANGARLVGFNLLKSSQSLAAFAEALLGGPFPLSPSGTLNSPADVYNGSFGLDVNAAYPFDSNYDSILASGVGTTRPSGGVGFIYVKSAGNGYGSLSGAGCGFSISAGLPCQNANMDPDNVFPWQIIVAATNAEGIRSSYSSAGSAVWVSGIGGEFGGSTATIAPGYPVQIYKPAVISTDQTGCGAGFALNTFNGSTTINPFNDFPNTANTNCNYTSTFNGTSAAAPVVSGVAALILQVNPLFTWRDVRHILAKTAFKVDPTAASVSVALGDGPYVAEPGWFNNAAPGGNGGPYHFHNWYGFGRVDVGAALTLAGTYTANAWVPLITRTNTSGSISLPIPDNNTTGASSALAISSGISFIEAVQITVSVTHLFPGDLGIELSSPSGTKSVLLNIRNGLENRANLPGMVLLSNAFYGEAALGTWTIKIVDGNALDTGTLTNWQIRVYGH